MSWRLLLVAATVCALQVHAMRVDPERIAARLRIEEEILEDRLRVVRNSEVALGRNRRQLATPKEISIQVTAPLFSSRLFEYGKEAGDQEVPLSMDVGKKVDLQNPIKFYGEDFATVFVLSNGAIGFDASSRSYKTNVIPGPAKLIAPFWNRNDLRNGGHVWYREIRSGRVLERGQSEIRYQYDKQVKVKSALVVTWEKMQPLGAAPLPDDNTNTFQAAVFMTDNGTFANFIYSNVGWTQGAEAGFNKGGGDEKYELPTSGTGNIMYLEEYGNTGIPGEWMFELGEEKIMRCKVGIKGDTCDEECSPGQWGADCSNCCHCSEGVCNPLTGQCNSGCTECWTGTSCSIKKDNCRTRSQVQCAANALSFTDKDRCGEPVPRCQCLAGFVGDGTTKCEDIDECAKPNTCHEKAICTNTPGKYFCQCMEGFSGDGIRQCVASFLYPTEGHQALPKTKNAKVSWQLKHPMKLFGAVQDKITISSSGVLALSDLSKMSSAHHLDEIDAHGIAPFFAPIDTSRGGQINVAEVNDSEVLSRVTRSIIEHFGDPNFEATNVLIVTFSNVTDGRSRKGNTFQTLLIGGHTTSGEPLSFVQLLYKDLPWSEGAEAGIMSSDLTNSVSLPGSGTEGIELLSQLSNVNQPGVWIYRIDDPVIPPCPRRNMQPPYCDAPALGEHTVDEARDRQPSRQPEQNTPQAPLNTEEFRPVGAPRVIQPTFANGNVPIPKAPPIQQAPPSTPNAPPTPSRTPPTLPPTTPRPRPAFNSTPHRPLVSVSDEDIENLPPDAFEITFPPFVTVIPEIFRDSGKGGASSGRPLPNFSATQIPIIPAIPPKHSHPLFESNDQGEIFHSESIKPVLAENTIHPIPIVQNTTGVSQEISPIEHFETALEPQPEPEPEPSPVVPTTAQSVNAESTDAPLFAPSLAPQDPELGPEEIDLNSLNFSQLWKQREETPTTRASTTEAPPTSEVTSSKKTPPTRVTPPPRPVTPARDQERGETADDQTDAPIFVFTTQKPTQRTTKKWSQKPQIVTASTADPIPDQPFQVNGEAERSTRLAIIIPVGIVAVWIVVLLTIVLYCYCKRTSSSRIRSMYGPTYPGRPITSYNMKRNSKTFEGSYEDHLEKAARLSSEMNPYNQNGRVSLYGSYWNLNNSPGSSQASNQRTSPYLGYPQQSRYQYTGRY